MAKRTKADLDAIFADNTTGEISPEDIRDFIDSAALLGAGYFWAESATTTINTQGVYEVATGTVTGVLASGFTVSTPNKALYTGSVDVDVLAIAFLSISCGNNDVVGIQFGKNGTVIPSSQIVRTMGAGNDIGAVSCSGLAELSPNDFIQLFIGNESDITDVTIEKGHVLVFSRFK